MGFIIIIIRRWLYGHVWMLTEGEVWKTAEVIKKQGNNKWAADSNGCVIGVGDRERAWKKAEKGARESPRETTQNLMILNRESKNKLRIGIKSFH